MFLYGFAFALSLLGLSLLFVSWRSISTMKGWFILLAWLTIIAAAYTWTLPGSVEFGICYAMIAISLQAWSLVVFGQSGAQPEKRLVVPVKPIEWPAVFRSIPRQFVTFCIAVPLAGLAAVQSTVVATLWLPWNTVNVMALGIYLMPVVWGVYAYWACMARARWLPALVLSLVVAGCSFLIYG